jgi:hypothetical protein
MKKHFLYLFAFLVAAVIILTSCAKSTDTPGPLGNFPDFVKEITNEDDIPKVIDNYDGIQGKDNNAIQTDKKNIPIIEILWGFHPSIKGLSSDRQHTIQTMAKYVPKNNPVAQYLNEKYYI